MPTVRWRFRDINEKGPEPFQYELEINPFGGGVPQIRRSLAILPHVGPWPSAPVQESHHHVNPRMSFEGTILTQEHYEAMEAWYMKRILLEIIDDVGRTMWGALVRWNPTRIRKPYDPWFHRYDAEFVIWAGENASGQPVYGILDGSGVDDTPDPPEPVPGDIPGTVAGAAIVQEDESLIVLTWNADPLATHDEVQRVESWEPD